LFHVDAYMKIYPAQKETEFDRWIDTTELKKLTVRVDRNSIPDDEFQKIFYFFLRHKYSAQTSNIFVKNVEFKDMHTEQKILMDNFNLKLI